MIFKIQLLDKELVKPQKQTLKKKNKTKRRHSSPSSYFKEQHFAVERYPIRSAVPPPPLFVRPYTAAAGATYRMSIGAPGTALPGSLCRARPAGKRAASAANSRCPHFCSEFYLQIIALKAFSCFLRRTPTSGWSLK